MFFHWYYMLPDVEYNTKICVATISLWRPGHLNSVVHSILGCPDSRTCNLLMTIPQHQTITSLTYYHIDRLKLASFQTTTICMPYDQQIKKMFFSEKWITVWSLSLHIFHIKHSYYIFQVFILFLSLDYKSSIATIFLLKYFLIEFFGQCRTPLLLHNYYVMDV